MIDVVRRPQRVVLPTWEIGDFETAEKMQAEIDRIDNATFFLVKIAGNGEVWRCRRCKAKHRYLTLMCVEQPFSGIRYGLQAYFKVAGAEDVREMLSPLQRARLNKIEKQLHIEALPDLSASHPQLARKVATAERDLDLGAFTLTGTSETPSELALGLLEPVSKATARQLVERINGRGLKPPLVVPGLDPVRR